ncbi:hypothetical protein [Armatimonas sp.]|uniref:hypothetical protein n=1 Tax=Armatimonas sp. TaxID=1872638 RepID=UPI00286C552A|nr:hypothetical protein [Armatimonas sp.]
MRFIATIASLLIAVPALAQEPLTPQALLTEARQSATQATDPLDRVTAWSAIARVEAKQKNIEGAKEAIRLAWSAANPNPKKKAQRLWLLRDWAAFDLEGAKQAASSLSGIQRRWAMEGIASVQAASGDLLGAYKIAQTLDDPRGAMWEIGYVQSQSTRPPVSKSLLQSPHPIQRGPGLVSLAREELKAENRAKALATLQEAEKVVRQITDPETMPGYRLGFLQAIGELRIQAGELEAGRVLFREVKDACLGLPEKEQNQRLSLLAIAQARTGDRLGALRTARGLQKTDARVSALAGIAGAL